jgi:hypothetical protein
MYSALTGCSPKKDKIVLESWEAQNTSFTIRITSFRQEGIFQAVAGADYVFEARPYQEDRWKEIMTVENDDPIPIDKNAVGFANEKIGFVFMAKKYAVTIDGGITWKIWDGIEVPFMKKDLSCGIQTVNLEESGTGTMNLKCGNNTKVLFTRDYGVNWIDEN